MTKFTEKVLRAVSRIPSGEVRTYKQIATIVGSPRAYRAVGTVLRKNYNPTIPCHRVIKSDGSVGFYNRGVTNKMKLLRHEGALA